MVRMETVMLVFGHMRKSLGETFPTRKSEWVLGFMLIAWGAVVAANPGYFETRPALSYLLKFASQHTWASAAFGVGLLRVSMLMINGTWRRSPHLRAMGSFLAAGVWFFIGAGLYQSGQAITGLVLYGGLFVQDALNFYTSMGEAASSDSRFGVYKKKNTQMAAVNHGIDT